MNNLYLFLAGLMAGMILFQAALNAPTIFKVYSEEQAGPFLRAIFPKLFLNVAVLSLMGFILSIIGDRLSLQALFFVSLLLTCIVSISGPPAATSSAACMLSCSLLFVATLVLLLDPPLSRTSPFLNWLGS